MSKSEFKPAPVPVFGQPVFIIGEYDLATKLNLSFGRASHSSLTYFAVDAILVKKLEFQDADMKKIIINQGMVDENNPERSIELRYNLETNFRSENSAATIFVYEEDAQATARKLNQFQKTESKKLLDAATLAFSSYDDIINNCVVK